MMAKIFSERVPKVKKYMYIENTNSLTGNDINDSSGILLPNFFVNVHMYANRCDSRFNRSYSYSKDSEIGKFDLEQES